MRPYLPLLLLLGLLAGPVLSLAETVPGAPLSRSYGSEHTRVKPGHMALATSPGGELYAGNQDGVLRFNGIDWRLTMLPARSAAHALAIGNDGLVYVGGYDTFGRLAPDGEGGVAYEELLDAAGLTGDQRHLGFVFQAISTPEGVYFRTEKRLILLPDDGKKARQWPLPESARSFYWVGGRMLARVQGQGLVRFEDGKLVLAPGGEALADIPLPGIVEREDHLLLVTNDGFYRADDRGVSRLPGPASDLLAGVRAYTVLGLSDGSLVVGTLDGSLLRFDAQLRIRQNLDLGTYGILGMAVDQESGLWLATENELKRLTLPSPWTHLGEDQGIAGNPTDFEWHDGALWLATSQGIQRMRPSDDGQPHAERLPWTDYEAYALHSAQGELLIGVREGLLALGPGDEAPRRMHEHPNHGVFALMPSRHDPNLVYGLSGPDVVLVHHRDGRWQEGPRFSLGDISIYGVEEGDAAGELWIGDSRGPVQRWTVNTETGEITSREVYDDSRGLAVSPQFGTSVYRFEERIHATSGDVGFRLEGDRFVPDKAPPITLVARPHEMYVEQTPLGDYAYTTRELWHRPKGETQWQPLYPGGRGMAGYSSVRYGQDGVLRIATWTGLLQFDPEESRSELQPLQLGMESVVAHNEAGETRVLPTRNNGAEPVRLPPGYSLSLRFAMVSMESGAEFRYLLHGVTPDWSDWADRDLFIRSLPPGDYALEVQARTGTGRQPAAMTYRFRVLPFWYQQWWVQALGGLVVLGLAVTVALWLVRLRTERFLEANRRLEARIAERTHELEDANRRLAELATEDALTGVANRRALENGLRREWYRCLDQRRSLSVLMIDVDHFKAYNDAHGHLEGDVQLRGIAQRLATQHDPQRELLSRYGGEEFALLLPGVHAEEATRRAESIRAAIASSDAGMTVSIGVAGMVPDVQSEPDSLLRRADAALYEAKRAGRNRVATDAGGAKV
ncbi:GGDEF domain-containing protein [Arenimonas soli]|uniref:diguanylate cyclase n=1 Tax=Arenimonas soli TaxID=2269504 RepID=A0ABQ1HKF3_9GAMM|nr:diguanylate cyclase [Arenimonas soli]GGA81104.1 GGDEF domain-containing protein [Arenimonas soli]